MLEHEENTCYVSFIYFSLTVQEFSCCLLVLLIELLAVFRIHRIHVFFGLPDPDPLVRGMDPDSDPDSDPAPDPDPCIIMQK